MVYQQLYRLARTLHELQADYPAMRRALLQQSGTLLGASQGLFFQFDDAGTLTTVDVASETVEAQDVAVWRAVYQRGLVGYVYHGQRPVTIRDLQNDPRWVSAGTLPNDGSAMGLPIQHDDAIIGVLLFVHSDVDAFTGERETFVREVMALASTALRPRDEIPANAATPSSHQANESNTSDQQQQRDHLAAMVYHDLRTPLQNVLASQLKLQSLLEEPGYGKIDDAIIERLLTLGVRSTRQLQRMIDSLLDIHKLEQDSVPLNLTTNYLHDVLQTAVQTMQATADAAGQTIILQITSDLPHTTFDEDMVTRVVVNLLENALKYSPDESHVQLRARRQADSLLVSVRDVGNGIPDAMHSRIFEKFSRLQREDTPRGVGLGLAFCRLAVEAHGGRIWVEPSDSGADIRFTLPVRQSTPDAEDDAENAERQSTLDDDDARANSA